MYKRAYVKVDLDRIRKNMKAIRSVLPEGTKIIGVVKADGYGHGAVQTAKAIEEDAAGYAVATAEEALELRGNGIKKPVLVLGPVPECQYGSMVEQEIRTAVFDLTRAERLSETAVSLGMMARVHIAVDTGMNRIGLRPSREQAQVVKEIAGLPGIVTEGMFTHFARADEADKTSAREQLQAFLDFSQMVKEAGVFIPALHCANSAGIMDLKESHITAVRAGIILYGLYPSDQVQREALFLEPAMELKSFITYIKEIGPGAAVSYGGTFVADRPVRLATVSIGYADGIPRILSNTGFEVLLHGVRVPIIGNICMDQLMIDVTGIPEAREGDEVTLLGRDGTEEITMEELADLSGRFHYEIPCLMGKRLPRVYVSGGRTREAGEL